MKKLIRKKFCNYFEEKIFWVTIIALSLTVSFIAVSMAEFYQTAYGREYQLQVESLENLTAQGSLILENRLKGYLSILSGAAAGFREGALHTEENMRKLQQIVESDGVEFARMALADTAGCSWITNGEQIDVGQTDYFRRAMQGESTVTESFASRVVNANVFIAAVPIFDTEEQIRGVLYGAVEIEEFRLYKNTRIEEALKSVQVIDKEGDYIIKSEPENQVIYGENFFEGLETMECSIPAREAMSRTLNGEDILLEVCNEGSEYVMFLSKLMVNDWHVVTVLDKNDIMGQVSFLLGRDIYWLILKVVIAFTIVCAGCVWYLRRDKRQIEKLYNQLKLNEEMMRTAVAAGRAGILFYDVRADRLKIIMRKNAGLELPKSVENASRTLVNYLPQNEKTRRQISEIFEKLKTIEKSDNLEFSLEVCGEMRDYMMHVEAMTGENDKDVHFVGIADDITEKTFLVKEMKMQENLFSGMIGFLVVELHEDRILRSSKKLQEKYKAEGEYSRLLQRITGENIVEEYQGDVKNRISVKRLAADYANNCRKVKVEYPCKAESGKLAWVECDIRLEQSRESGHCLAYIVLRDISDTKDTEELLRERANKDYLTGLYNRRGAEEMINQFLMQSAVSEGSNAFVILDLDNFKLLNDVHGHQMGDAALIDVANVLSSQFRKYDVVSRLAGDEFVLFLKNIPLSVIETKVKDLLKRLHLTYTKNGKSVSISASAGIAVTPKHGMDFSALYQNADKALYEAKNAGKGRCVICGQGTERVKEQG